MDHVYRDKRKLSVNYNTIPNRVSAKIDSVKNVIATDSQELQKPLNLPSMKLAVNIKLSKAIYFDAQR
jgi:hypothetical protein